MPRPMKHPHARNWRAAMPVAAIVGLATAALVGVAFAKTFTLQVVKNATVMNTAGTTKHESIVVNPRGRAVYALSGDSQRHPECTKASGCFKFWPPVTVSSAKKLNKGPGVAGRLGVWHRNGLVQVTLGGHPLYAFAADAHKGLATGEGLRSFGGTWHVIKASAARNRERLPRRLDPPPHRPLRACIRRATD